MCGTGATLGPILNGRRGGSATTGIMGLITTRGFSCVEQREHLRLEEKCHFVLANKLSL